MDKRVIVFLVLSLAIILGFDLLMRQMGWLPEPPPAQDGSAQAPASSERDPAPAVPAGKDGVSSPEYRKPIKFKVWRTGVEYPFAVI